MATPVTSCFRPCLLTGLSKCLLFPALFALRAFCAACRVLAGTSLLLLLPTLVAAQPASQDSGTLTQQIAEYERAISELDGVYSTESAELYQSLAQALTRSRNFSAAADAYQEALQSLRVVEGLASSTQQQLIDEFNPVLFELQRWEALDTNYHLSHTIAERLYGAEHPNTINAATTLASWKIRAWQTGVYRPRGDRSVQEASEIYRKLLGNLDDGDANSHGLRANWLSSRGLAYFYAARHVASLPVTEFQHSAPQTSSFQQCVPLVMSVDGALPSANACHANQNLDPEYYASQQREKNNTVRRHLGNMRQSFMEAIEAIEANPRATLEQRVQAILNLGDANLLAEDYTRARSQYARAWELLSADDENLGLRQRLLDTPTLALRGLLDALPFDEALPGQEVKGTVAFDVTETGELENINVTGEGALTQDNIAAIAIKLDQSVFRPRIVEGRPVRSRLSLPAADL